MDISPCFPVDFGMTSLEIISMNQRKKSLVVSFMGFIVHRWKWDGHTSLPINRFGLGKNQQSSSTAGMLLSLSPFLLGEIHTFADESPSSLADSLDSHPFFFFGKSNYSYLIHNSLNHIQLMYFLCLIIFQSAYFRGFFQQRECRNQLRLVPRSRWASTWHPKLELKEGEPRGGSPGSTGVIHDDWHWMMQEGVPPHLK